MNLFKKNREGFTLIELLVAIAIITILASLVLVNYANSQKKSRDSKRKADLESLQQAVYMYKDANEKFPTYEGVISEVTFQQTMVPFISPLPHDPKKASGSPDYYYYNGGATFAFFSDLEITTDPDRIIGGCKIDGITEPYKYRAPKVAPPGTPSPCKY